MGAPPVYLHYLVLFCRELPPGPWAPLPFIGTSSRLNQMKPYITLVEWSKIYGDVFSLTQLGGIKTIVCSDEESIKEVGNFPQLKRILM